MARKASDMINETLAHFDFERVHETMQLLKWTWAGEGVPGIKKLMEEAEHHLTSAIEQALDPTNTEHHEVGWISASGGFKATAWKNSAGELDLIKLEFVITEWDTYNSEN